MKPGNEIQVWIIDLDKLLPDLPFLKSTLGGDEVAREQRYRSLDVSQRFILARGALRMICGEYLGCDPTEVIFGYGTYGKPFISQPNAEIRFSLAHSGGLALAAFAQNMGIGIDIEMIHPVAEMETIVGTHFSASEKAQFIKLPDCSKPVAFFNTWTRKEAYLKGKGCGLHLPLDEFDVSIIPGCPVKVLNNDQESSESEIWQLVDLVLPGYGQYCASLSYCSVQSCHLSYRTFCQCYEWMDSY